MSNAVLQKEQALNIFARYEKLYKAGDLAFFDNEEGKITHVGIMLNNSQIIHASGKVKIDRIDNQGIYSTELQKYSHKLRIVKRYV